MNRFFSKLDLRDIKIDPTNSRFPPDGEEYEMEDDVQVESAPAVDGVVADGAPSGDATPWVAASTTTLEAAGDAVVDTGYPIEQPVVQHENGEVLKVSARSRPSAVAGAIAGVVREMGRAEVQAIGAGATNQAVKAVAIARDYLRETGIDAVCLPAFIDVTIDNEDRTAIRLVVESR
jgi:stage V sporulation protein S